MWLTPALFSAALGLAAGSLASDGALERRGRSGAVAIAVGGSAFVAWTAVGYAANLALDVVVMAAAVMALEVARGRRGVCVGAVLVVGAVLLHWMFALLFVGVLVVMAVIRSIRRGDEADRSPRVPLGGLARMLAIGTVVGVIGLLLLAPQRPSRLPEVDSSRPGPAGRVELRLPALALPVTTARRHRVDPPRRRSEAAERRCAPRHLGIPRGRQHRGLVPPRAATSPLPLGRIRSRDPHRDRARSVRGRDLLERRGHASSPPSPSRERWRRWPGSREQVHRCGGVWSRPWTRMSSGSSAHSRPTSGRCPRRRGSMILIEPYRKRAPFNRAWTGLPADRLRFITMIPARIDERARSRAPARGPRTHGDRRGLSRCLPGTAGCGSLPRPWRPPDLRARGRGHPGRGAAAGTTSHPTRRVGRAPPRRVGLQRRGVGIPH